ncbi:hypothetical protein C2E23DRAFT_612743 [Lenzites betulinus]|nr:hypothetical protein C2E23DRAFT_612743 [Lenzites betulinus]
MSIGGDKPLSPGPTTYVTLPPPLTTRPQQSPLHLPEHTPQRKVLVRIPQAGRSCPSRDLRSSAPPRVSTQRRSSRTSSWSSSFAVTAVPATLRNSSCAHGPVDTRATGGRLVRAGESTHGLVSRLDVLELTLLPRQLNVYTVQNVRLTYDTGYRGRSHTVRVQQRLMASGAIQYEAPLLLYLSWDAHFLSDVPIPQTAYNVSGIYLELEARSRIDEQFIAPRCNASSSQKLSLPYVFEVPSTSSSSSRTHTAQRNTTPSNTHANNSDRPSESNAAHLHCKNTAPRAPGCQNCRSNPSMVVAVAIASHMDSEEKERNRTWS